MKKRFVAFLLVLIMVLGMLPVSAFAADDGVSPQALNTGHKIDVTFTVLYVGNEFNIGYNYGTSEKTQFVCQYSTPHSDTAYNNHTIAISDIKAAADRASVNSGYQIVGWSKESNANPTVWPLNKTGTTACNKGTTIYLVAKDPNPQVTYTLNYHANGGDENSVPASQTEKSNTGKVTFTVSSKEPTRDGYKFLGWNGNPNDTTVTVKGGNTITTTAKVTNLYAVWESKTPPADKPVKPGEGDFEKAGLVSVECSTKPADHAKETYDLKKDTFTIGEVEGNATDGYTCEITVTADSYVSSYVATHGAHTLTGDNTKKFTLTWVSGKWVAKEGGVTFPVQCEQTPPPEIPGDQKPNIEEANAKIRVQCIEYPSKHNPYKQNYRILPGSYDDLGWDRTEYGYIYSIRLNRAKYIAQFDQEIGRPHTDTEPNEETRINWRWENGAWHLIDGPDGVTADIKVKCAETPVEPKKPTALDGSFAIVCKNNEATHAHKADYIATPSQYTISDVQTDEQGYYVTATVTVAPNLVAYNTLTGAEHRLVNEQDATLTITFRYDTEVTGDENRKWKQQGEVPVVEVICEPKAPTADDLKKLDMAVLVKCVVDNSQQHTEAYGLLGECDVDYFVGEPRKDGDDWLCDISYYPERYVAAFNTTFQNLKHVQNDEKIVPVTLIWAGDSWQIKEQGRVHVTEEYTVTFNAYGGFPTPDEQHVKSGEKAVLPVAPTLKGYTFAFWYLGDDEQNATAYDFNTPVTENITLTAKWNINKYTVTFNSYGGSKVDPQVVEYGLYAQEPEEPTLKGFTFAYWYLDDENEAYDFDTTPITEDITLTAKWEINKFKVTFDTDGGEPIPDDQFVEWGLFVEEPTTEPTKTGYTFDGWYLGDERYDFSAAVEQNITLTAKWEAKKANVHLMIFKSGDLSTPIVNVPYATDKLAGDTIDLAEIDLSSYLDFDFEIDGGWYDDGLFNLYKKYVNGEQENKPAALTELQINGNWQNLKLIVTELVPVVYFDSLESLTAYQNDHSKTEGILHTTKARLGSALPTTDAPTATRDGYTFTFWSREGQTVDVTDQTVNGWTNLYANWKVTPHNIYAYARLNSYFAPLTTKEFDTPITLNEATLSRLGLGSYNSLGYISIGSFTFDAMPLTSDLYFDDDAELSAVAEKLATDIALETGVSDKIAEKIAWTALYKTVNEEDMAPGYPAEAGYQLSGNLNLASVTFRAGAENVENMPAVNYTYDDGAIDFYDFYFAGDTFTMPADPTREGYSFEGWSVKVLPAENDADHLDADGADDAADETLLKAGDTYTITAGGVIFTAQWKKKTFTVKYYLPDETGAWVEKKMDTVDSVDYATYSLWTPNAEDGYEFSGWYQKTADIGVKAKVEKLYMAKEWKLYGKFTPIEYTIQYVYNDGKATSTNPTTYTVESDTITLADATGADWGKTFLEWHDENGQKITEIPTGSTGDRVITAYWNWPVHLHYLDKDNNEIESATLYVSELEPGACVLPTGEKTGYDFDGWYEAKKDIGTASHKLNALSIAKKWELYGRYTAKTDVSYTVKYLREGDNKVLAPEKVVTDQTFDTEVTEQAADVVGYTPDAPSKTMILDEYNKVLTFSYSANTYRYEIHYFLQEPDGSYMEKEVDTTPTGVFDTTVTITPDPNRYGAHYSYNSVKSVVSGVVTVDDPATILKLNVYYDLDFHTLTFDTMGGSAIDPVTVRHGNAVARPTDPTKDKYTFIGWYADPEFTEEYDFATVLEADKTIYAKFELTSTPIGDIYVRYDVLHIKQLPDGTYDLANAEVEHLSAKKDTTVTAVVKDYSATHHINVNSTLSKLTDTAIQPYPGADGKPVYTILSVYYDLDFHTLTFDTMGGSRIDPVTVRHGNAVAKPKDPVNGGYIFDGWYTDKTYRTPYNFATVLTQDTTIYAKWFLIALPGVTIKKTTPKLNTSDHFAYVQGYPDGTVKPAGNITRAETAAILFRLMDEGSRKTYYSTKSGFRDVATGSWYNTYVATLNNAGVITDSSNGYFRPNEAITRAELAAMLANFTETAGAANYFNDVSASYWAANAIAICAKLGWITGYPDGSFRPDRNVTRAELMAMINRATGRAPKSADAFLPGMKTWSDNTADKWYYLDVQEATNSHSYTVKDSEKWTALNADPNWSLYE